MTMGSSTPDSRNTHWYLLQSSAGTAGSLRLTLIWKDPSWLGRISPWSRTVRRSAGRSRSRGSGLERRESSGGETPRGALEREEGQIFVLFPPVLGGDGLLSGSDPGLCLQVLRILLGDSAHPGLFGFCSLGVTVIVKHQMFINQTNIHKLWEVWDSRGCSEEVLQRVNHCNRKIR
ncbi:hypothetical protein EYF80_027667 [Liparis tanakae]|uniref:Uncharacterized protein n=1 Tax=Liparis tanakae TaxID=230148 RepID=A0A4Z2H8H3_9TELE|nr:hypothetical protein EYF80_027667 [Liparis tanakae]